MEFTSAPVPYGPGGLRHAKTKAVLHAEAQAERFGYRVTTRPSFTVTGDDERGGTVVARAEARPVSHSW